MLNHKLNLYNAIIVMVVFLFGVVQPTESQLSRGTISFSRINASRINALNWIPFHNVSTDCNAWNPLTGNNFTTSLINGVFTIDGTKAEGIYWAEAAGFETTDQFDSTNSITLEMTGSLIGTGSGWAMELRLADNQHALAVASVFDEPTGSSFVDIRPVTGRYVYPLDIGGCGIGTVIAENVDLAQPHSYRMTYSERSGDLGIIASVIASLDNNTPISFDLPWRLNNPNIILLATSRDIGDTVHATVTRLVAGTSYFISGKVTDSSGNPISGVSISASGGYSATTDGNGNYTLSDLSTGTYTLTPTKSGYAFSPPSRTVSVPPDATGVNFIGTQNTTYLVSGKVTDGSSNPISGVSISASGGYSATTDSNGNYTLSGLPSGTYTVTPAKNGYTFSPPSQTVSVPPDATGVDFVGTLVDNSPPATITNLLSAAGNQVGTVSLTWTAPGDNGSGGGNAALYDLRYSSGPISTSNWASVTQVNGEPSPSSPGSTQSLEISNPELGTRWYFGIKTRDTVGNWSDLSNIPSILDSGLRPVPQGYKFCNGPNDNNNDGIPDRACDPGWGKYPSPPPNSPANNDYTFEDMRRMFGDAAVCTWPFIPGLPCLPKFSALMWLENQNNSMNGGHCFGMAHASLRFFKGVGDPPSTYQDGANFAHDLELSNARRNIAYYFVEQFALPTKAYIIGQLLLSTPSSTLTDLLYGLSKNSSDPGILVLFGEGGGHAVTPYAIEDRSNGIYWVKVYDNNHPDDVSRKVVINTVNNNWSYDLGGRTWSGDANTHSLFVVPSSLLNGPQICPVCLILPQQDQESFGPTQAQSEEVWLDGGGHLIITNSQGQRIGYIGDQFVDEIPDASAIPIIGGVDFDMEPYYDLPLTETYSIQLDGQTLTLAANASIAQFAPGYAVSIADITIGPASQDELMISNDGTALVYQTNEAREPTITLALDSSSESRQFTIQQADFSAGDTGGVTADLNAGKLEFDNSQSAGGEYNFSYKINDENGQWIFSHTGIDIPANATHYLDFGKWDGSTSMILEVDLDSDGDIDEYIDLDNEANRLYLPIAIR